MVVLPVFVFLLLASINQHGNVAAQRTSPVNHHFHGRVATSTTVTVSADEVISTVTIPAMKVGDRPGRATVFNLVSEANNTTPRVTTILTEEGSFATDNGDGTETDLLYYGGYRADTIFTVNSSDNALPVGFITSTWGPVVFCFSTQWITVHSTSKSARCFKNWRETLTAVSCPDDDFFFCAYAATVDGTSVTGRLELGSPHVRLPTSVVSAAALTASRVAGAADLCFDIIGYGNIHVEVCASHKATLKGNSASRYLIQTSSDADLHVGTHMGTHVINVASNGDSTVTIAEGWIPHNDYHIIDIVAILATTFCVITWMIWSTRTEHRYSIMSTHDRDTFHSVLVVIEVLSMVLYCVVMARQVAWFDLSGRVYRQCTSLSPDGAIAIVTFTYVWMAAMVVVHLLNIHRFDRRVDTVWRDLHSVWYETVALVSLSTVFAGTSGITFEMSLNSVFAVWLVGHQTYVITMWLFTGRGALLATYAVIFVGIFPYISVVMLFPFISTVTNSHIGGARSIPILLFTIIFNGIIFAPWPKERVKRA